MALAFRNVAAEPSDPVSTWPTEAVQAALERGDIDDWRRILRETSREPWGRTARQVTEVLSHSRPYGVAELMEAALARSRGRCEESERSAVVEELRGLVAVSGMTNGDFAAQMGTSASRFSTYVNGTVVPSAALMVRARRIARGSRGQDASLDA